MDFNLLKNIGLPLRSRRQVVRRAPGEGARRRTCVQLPRGSPMFFNKLKCIGLPSIYVTHTSYRPGAVGAVPAPVVPGKDIVRIGVYRQFEPVPVI